MKTAAGPMSQKQVEPDHYNFESYENEARFTSYYHQVRAVLKLQPQSLIELGSGNGLFINLIRNFGVASYNVDIDVALKPTVCGSVLNLPILDNSVDICAAFQILEHLPFENFRSAVQELGRISTKGVVISLPEFGNTSVVLSIPFVRKIHVVFRATPFHPTHRFDGQHYWEINKHGYSLSRILRQLEATGMSCDDNWLNPYNPYHRFFVLRKSY